MVNEHIVKWKYLIIQLLPTIKKTSKGLDFGSLPKIEIWFYILDLIVFTSKLSIKLKL